MDPLRIFVACAPGLEPLLRDEVAAVLGGADAAMMAGGVELDGELGTVYRLNLGLGLASHVLVRLGAFRARHFPELERAATRLPWDRWLRKRQPVEVRCSSSRSRLYHTAAIGERVRRSVAKGLGGESPDAGTGTRIVVRLVRDECTVSIDTSGEPLHRRGYREETGKAPLREDLARALVLVSGWDRQSPLVDPLMGAGTIPIEAALLARRLPPGALRRFAFMGFPGFEAADFDRLRAEMSAGALASLPFRIHGADRDRGAVEAARRNAERAGVSADLELVQAPLSAAPHLADPAGAPSSGVLVTDPPYGRRTAARGLRTLYQSLGRRFGALPAGWRLAMVSSDRRLAHATGLPLRSALLTDRGGTRVRFLVTDRG